MNNPPDNYAYASMQGQANAAILSGEAEINEITLRAVKTGVLQFDYMLLLLQLGMKLNVPPHEMLPALEFFVKRYQNYVSGMNAAANSWQKAPFQPQLNQTSGNAPGLMASGSGVSSISEADAFAKALRELLGSALGPSLPPEAGSFGKTLCETFAAEEDAAKGV